MWKCAVSRRTELKKRRKWKALGFILPSFCGMFLFYLLPYLDVVKKSFTDLITGDWIGFENYREVLKNEAFLLASGNTIQFMIVCIPLLLGISLLLAVILQKIMNGKFLQIGLLLPMAIPVASVVLLWKGTFDLHGFLNVFLHIFGIKGKDWMNTDSAFGVMVFSYIWKNLGYSVTLWLVGLTAIPKQIYEAANIDGAGEIKSFFHITIPNLLPTLFTNTVISLINSFKVYREAYLVAGDYPEQSIYMMQHLFNNWFRNLSLSDLAVGAVIITLVFLILIWGFWKGWGKMDE